MPFKSRATDRILMHYECMNRNSDHIKGIRVPTGTNVVGFPRNTCTQTEEGHALQENITSCLGADLLGISY